MVDKAAPLVVGAMKMKLILAGLVVGVLTLIAWTVAAVVVGIQSGFDREWMLDYGTSVIPTWMIVGLVVYEGISTDRANARKHQARIEERAMFAISLWQKAGWWVQVERDKKGRISKATRHTHGPDEECSARCGDQLTVKWSK